MVYYTGVIADRIDNCSTICECYFLPTENATTIQCSKKNLTTAPTIFPVFENKSSLFVHLIMSDNWFEVQPNLTSYRITLLDISGNGLTTLYADLLPKSLKVKKIIYTFSVICSFYSSLINRILGFVYP